MANKYKSYNRIHKYSNPSDVEKGKIKRETTNFIKSDKKCKELSKKLLNEYSDCQDELLDQYEEFKLISVKEMKNAKGHKNRLKELSKNKDFI